MLDFGTRKTAKNRKRLKTGVELIVDNFAGGGGASTGIEMALQRAVDMAINHDPSALHMHEFNHPATRHYCESVWKIDPVMACKGYPVGLAWFSPDCRHFSRAKGKKPVSNKIRCLAWIVVRWARKVKPRLIMLENVREFQDWGPLIQARDTGGNLLYEEDGKPTMVPDPTRKGESFKRWVRELKYLGYKVEYKVLNAADFGAPTHRRRLFIIARCDDKPIKWPRPTHGPGRKPYRTAAECIDWSIPCPSIFDRKKPLAEKTLRRIALGIKRYVLENPSPFIVEVNHGGEGFRGQSINEPMSTVCKKHGQAAVVPTIVRIGQTGGNGKYSNGADEPLTTITKKAEHCLVTAHISTYYGANKESNEFRGHAADEPIRTQTTENRHALVAAMLTKHYGGVVGTKIDQPAGTITSVDHHALTAASLIRMGQGEKQWSSVEDPLGTVMAGGLKFGLVYAFLCKYFGTAIGQEVDDPLHTISVVTVKIDGVTYAIADIGMRMLQPRELARAQGFPDDYILTGSKSNQVAKIGNSVCPQVACALVKANWRKS